MEVTIVLMALGLLQHSLACYNEGRRRHLKMFFHAGVWLVIFYQLLVKLDLALPWGIILVLQRGVIAWNIIWQVNFLLA